MNQIQIFNYKDNDVRTIIIDGELWFVAMDVAAVLGYSETSAMTRSIDSEDIRKAKPANFAGLSKGNNLVTLINEPGLYSAVLGSSLPGARDFKRWVVKVVLPSIRKTGQYSHTPQIVNADHLVPKTRAELIYEWGKALVELEQKKEIIVAQQPMIATYEAVMSATDGIPIAHVAKTIKEFPVLKIGRNILIRIMRYLKILDRNNVPYQEYMNRGYFYVVTSNPNEIGLTNSTFVMARGIEFIRDTVLSMTDVEIGKASESEAVVKALAKFRKRDIQRNRNAVIPVKKNIETGIYEQRMIEGV